MKKKDIKRELLKAKKGVLKLSIKIHDLKMKLAKK
jgi:hypothetical protein